MAGAKDVSPLLDYDGFAVYLLMKGLTELS